ncbi:hypothetical protein EV651_11293 [Kribbella sp. VKM Ac-2571]|uniref:hypothetical protein n=1 Tax=Kribbella sp. VKM Ac-2571 TaxID=2512222 RepID=UPI0010EC8BBC|nr:hypothetical protein [Kribbella sp. VKM Ac-2571]TDO56706.1 hypothetical protein EV651_11293 [Kribbella sp. VKM Ac-2571]
MTNTLPAWEETGYFSGTDRAALRLTEAITLVSDGHVSDADYDAAAAALTRSRSRPSPGWSQ